MEGRSAADKHPVIRFLSGLWEIVSHIALYCAGIGLIAFIWGAITNPDFFTTYPKDYEAHFEIEGKTVFCVATLDCSSDYVEYAHGNWSKIETTYKITKLSLPYDRFAYVDAIYDKKQNRASISLGEWGEYSVTLGSPADEKSYDILRDEVVSTHGEFCASKKSGKFHTLKCKYAKSIGAQNLIYFLSEKEADAFGYTMCAKCAESY